MEAEKKQDKLQCPESWVVLALIEEKQNKVDLNCVHCSKPLAAREVQNGENKGKRYYKCGNPKTAGCNKFFKWAEQLQEGSDSVVQCDCPDTAVKQTVKKEGKNKDRVFYQCGRLKAFQCKFWKWEEEVVSSPLEDAAEVVLCNCENPAVKQVVKKEGKNKGRIFFHCGKGKEKCKFWRWGTKKEQELEAKSREQENKEETEEDKKPRKDALEDESSSEDDSKTKKEEKGRKRESSDSLKPSGGKSAKLE